MEKDFWLTRWTRAETGFHQHDVNLYLATYWSYLQITPQSEVFVPLCGKSYDMIWLHRQGYQVLGVELSDIAVQAFFVENNLSYQTSTQGKFTLYQSEGIRILCGDVFDLSAEHVQHCRAMFDRAALIALPFEMRSNYVKHLLTILPKNCRGLLVTLDYPQTQMDGPPFAVSVEEVRRHYQTYVDVQLLLHQNVLAENEKFRVRGVTELHENVFLLS